MNYFIITLLIINVYLFLKNQKALHMLQQNWYNDSNRYIKWIYNNYKVAFLAHDVYFPLLVATRFFDYVLVSIMVIIFYITISYKTLKERKTEQVKKAIVYTPRIKRLMITTEILYLIPVVTMLFNFNTDNLFKYYFIVMIMVYLNYIIVLLANYINKPVEKLVYLYYKNKAITKLNNLSNLSVIGITGSYGKTSSKNILNDILNVKYNAFATPKSFNTPYGLIIAINNHLDKFNDFFIAEMGAFYKGEIKGMCNLVKPKYGILTNIGKAHLETFGSQENIQTGKFELIESLPSDGLGILNGDDPLQLSYKLNNDCQIMWIGIDNHDVDIYAKDIKLSDRGTTFKVVFNGTGDEYIFETKLLGKANVYNILAGIALGHYLNMSINQLQLGVSKINTIEHRLELKKYGTINIIDDAYNSNPTGAKMALDVLKLMPGTKIVVTPGMIELGDDQDILNLEFGKQMASVANYVILVGKTQTKPIYEGLKLSDFEESHIFVINDVKEAFKIMRTLNNGETYVLIENDLPDLFNE